MTEPNGRASAPLANTALGLGRLPILALMGLAAGALPLPLLPPKILASVRGAVAHDVASRYGLSLTDRARYELSRPSAAVSRGTLVTTALYSLRRSYRRLGPMGVIPPVSAWFEVYALGILLDRYLARTRASSTVRIDEAEAHALRRTIDQAIRRSLSMELLPATREEEAGAAEDLRTLPMRLSDGLLLAVAELPLFLRRRLEAAFDAEATANQNRTKEHVGA